jgi:hypothetical protein
LQAKAADAKHPSGKKRSVIDISATATAMRLPERPGPLPGATASPLQVRARAPVLLPYDPHLAPRLLENLVWSSVC